MRISLAQAAAGALTSTVVAGLIVLPGRVLGTDPARTGPLSLRVQAAAATTVVPAAQPVVHHRVAPKPHRVPAAPVAQLASAPVAVAVVRRAAPRPTVVTRRRVVIARVAPKAAVRRRHLPLPPDEARPQAPVPAPTPAPAPAPTPAPAAAPAAGPAAASPAAVPAVPAVQVLADMYAPAVTTQEDPGRHGNKHDGEHDNGHGHDADRDHGRGSHGGN